MHVKKMRRRYKGRCVPCVPCSHFCSAKSVSPPLGPMWQEVFVLPRWGSPWCLLPAWVIHAVSRHSLRPRNKAHSQLDYSHSTGFCFSSCALICKPLNKRHKAVCKIGSRVCCPVKPLGLPKPGFSSHHNWYFKAPSMTKLTTTTKMGGKGGNEKRKTSSHSKNLWHQVNMKLISCDTFLIYWWFFTVKFNFQHKVMVFTMFNSFLAKMHAERQFYFLQNTGFMQQKHLLGWAWTELWAQRVDERLPKSYVKLAITDRLRTYSTSSFPWTAHPFWAQGSVWLLGNLCQVKKDSGMINPMRQEKL